MCCCSPNTRLKIPLNAIGIIHVRTPKISFNKFPTSRLPTEFVTESRYKNRLLIFSKN